MIEKAEKTLELAKKVAKKIVEENIPDELPYFEAIWETLVRCRPLEKYREDEGLSFRKFDNTCAEELGFLDLNGISKINTFKVSLTLIWALANLAELKCDIDESTIKEVLNKYGKSLPDWLSSAVIRLGVPLIMDDLRKVGKGKYEIKPSIISMATEIKFKELNHYEEEKAYEIIYRKKGKKLEKKEMGKKELEDFLSKNRKEDFDIWINELREEFFIQKKKIEKIPPLQLSLIEELLINSPNLVSFKELFNKFARVKEPFEGHYYQFNLVHRWIANARKLDIVFRENIKNILNEGYRWEGTHEFCILRLKQKRKKDYESAR